MANILLTQTCVRSCPYCFAKKHMKDSPMEDILSWENLIYIADLLETSGTKNVSLLGGEPTLHPCFVDFVLYLLERNFRVNVFTSGIMSGAKFEELAAHLAGTSPERLSFICNVNNPDQTQTSQSQLRQIDRFLTVFNQFTGLSFNVYRADFNIDFIFQYINAYGLKRHLRLGLAHPIPNKDNLTVAIDDMPEMITSLSSYFDLLERFRVTLDLDCGIPMCLFSDADLGRLFKLSPNTLYFDCSPVVDIGPDMNVWSCFPLSNYNKRSVFDFNSEKEIVDFYRDLHAKIRTEVGGLFERCDDCLHRENRLCAGGCAAHILSNLAGEPPIRISGISCDE